MCCLQLFEGRQPFAGMDPIKAAALAASKGLRPEFQNKRVPEQVKQILYLSSIVLFNLYSVVVFYSYSVVFNVYSLVFNLYSVVFNLYSVVFNLYSVVFNLYLVVLFNCIPLYEQVKEILQELWDPIAQRRPNIMEVLVRFDAMDRGRSLKAPGVRVSRQPESSSGVDGKKATCACVIA